MYIIFIKILLIIIILCVKKKSVSKRVFLKKSVWNNHHYFNEKDFYNKFEFLSFVPNMIKYDDNDHTLTLSHVGEGINYKNIPKNYKYQLQKIDKELKKYKIYHNDLCLDHIFVLNNNIYIIDWAQYTQNNPRYKTRPTGNDHPYFYTVQNYSISELIKQIEDNRIEPTFLNPKVHIFKPFTNLDLYKSYTTEKAILSKNTGGGGLYQSKQRNPQLRLNLLKDINFLNKTILDIGCNSGTFLKLLSPQIKWGVGVDFDPLRVNEANVMAKNEKLNNISFYNFDLKNEPFKTLLYLMDNKPDIIFLFAICQEWIYPCTELIKFIKNNSKLLCIEINGSESKKEELIKELHSNYDNVIEKTNKNYCQDCQNRRLFYAYNSNIPNNFL